MIGRILAHYHITSALGAGGMGEVYRATDTKLGRDVAMKVLPPQMASSAERRERFQREARALAALDHPHIVTIHSVEEADGVHFLTMELVEGRSLDQLIPKRGLPVERILEIGTAVADALGAAHDKGIIHRDLKPANVMVTSGGRVKVLDFGLAKLAADRAADDELPATELQTREGVVMGTGPYMSPEQVTGRPVDQRTDVFSLGILLFEMATGEPPFRGRSPAELASSILRDTPPSITGPRPDVPADLARIVRRCLEREVHERVQTARGAANELRDLARQATSQPSGTTRDAAIAIAVLPFSDLSPAKDQQHLCEGMAEEIMNALVHIAGIRVASRTSAFLARQNAGDLPAIGRALSVGHVLEGSVRTSGSRLRVTAQLTDITSGYQLWSERFDRSAQDIFEVQDEISAGVVEAVKARLTTRSPVVARRQLTNFEAYGHYLQARHLRYTKSDHRGALRCYKQALELDPSHAPSWVGLAEVTSLACVYSLVRARDAYATGKEALAKAANEQGESAEARYVEGTIAFGERDWPACERAVLRALELEPDDVRALGWYARLLVALGRIAEARPVLQRAQEIDPLAPYPYATTGFCLLAAGRPAEAQGYFDQALTFDADNSLALWARGVALIALGRAEEAVAPLERASAAAQRSGHYHAVLGWALAAAGRVDEARDVLHVLRARPAPAPPIVAEAWLLASLDDRDAAFDVLDRAAAEFQATMAFPGMPGFDPLRRDPRFAALIRRLGLPQ